MFGSYESGGKEAGYFYFIEDSTLVSKGKGVTHGWVGSLAAMAPNCRGNFNLFWPCDIVQRETRLFPLGNNVPNLRDSLFRSNIRSSSNSSGVPTSNVQIWGVFSSWCKADCEINSQLRLPVSGL